MKPDFLFPETQKKTIYLVVHLNMNVYRYFPAEISNVNTFELCFIHQPVPKTMPEPCQVHGRYLLNI